MPVRALNRHGLGYPQGIECEAAGGRPGRGRKTGAHAGFRRPCDPTLKEKAPEGPNWIYEIKTDGYRAQVHIREGKVIVCSRSGYDWTQQFATIAEAAKKLKVRDAIIDGEATVKTFKRTRGQVWLMPHNPAFDPIPGNEAAVLGKIVTVLRKI